MKTVVNSLALLAAILLFLGYLGHLHPLLDAIAIGRWVAIYALLSLLALRAALSGSLRYAVLGIAAMVLVFAFNQQQFGGAQGPVRIYTKNLLYLNVDLDPIIADIRKADPDIVVLQEVSTKNISILAELQTDYPFVSVCPWQGWNGMAILSRWPLADATKRCSKDRALMAVKLRGETGDFWMIGAHLQHPWPDIQWPLLEASLPVLQNLDAPAIVAGDFNTFHWTAAAQRVGQVTRTRPIPTRRPTYMLWNIGLHIDQVWASDGRAHVRPRFSSDHRGIVADVWP